MSKRTDITHPDSFKEGVRVLLLMLRAKDGGSAKTDRRATKKITTTSAAEFDEGLEELRVLWQEDQRIYSTVNARNIGKAIRIFKYRQLDNEYFAEKDRHNFYFDLENRWISCLKDGKTAVDSLFLFDVDDDDKAREEIIADVSRAQTSVLGKSIFKIVDSYNTRNGMHIITQPFNPSILGTNAEKVLMKNALMLWSY